MGMKVPDLTDAEMRLLCSVVDHAPGDGRAAAAPDGLGFFQWPWVRDTVIPWAMPRLEDDWRPVLADILEKLRAVNEGGV